MASLENVTLATAAQLSMEQGAITETESISAGVLQLSSVLNKINNLLVRANKAGKTGIVIWLNNVTTIADYQDQCFSYFFEYCDVSDPNYRMDKGIFEWMNRTISNKGGGYAALMVYEKNQKKTWTHTVNINNTPTVVTEVRPSGFAVSWKEGASYLEAQKLAEPYPMWTYPDHYYFQASAAEIGNGASETENDKFKTLGNILSAINSSIAQASTAGKTSCLIETGSWTEDMVKFCYSQYEPKLDNTGASVIEISGFNLQDDNATSPRFIDMESEYSIYTNEETATATQCLNNYVNNRVNGGLVSLSRYFSLVNIFNNLGFGVAAFKERKNKVWTSRGFIIDWSPTTIASGNINGIIEERNKNASNQVTITIETEKHNNSLDGTYNILNIEELGLGNEENAALWEKRSTLLENFLTQLQNQITTAQQTGKSQIKLLWSSIGDPNTCRQCFGSYSIGKSGNDYYIDSLSVPNSVTGSITNIRHGEYFTDGTYEDVTCNTEESDDDITDEDDDNDNTSIISGDVETELKCDASGKVSDYTYSNIENICNIHSSYYQRLPTINNNTNDFVQAPNTATTWNNWHYYDNVSAEDYPSLPYELKGGWLYLLLKYFLNYKAESLGKDILSQFEPIPHIAKQKILSQWWCNNQTSFHWTDKDGNPKDLDSLSWPTTKNGKPRKHTLTRNYSKQEAAKARYDLRKFKEIRISYPEFALYSITENESNGDKSNGNAILVKYIDGKPMIAMSFLFYGDQYATKTTTIYKECPDSVLPAKTSVITKTIKINKEEEKTVYRYKWVSNKEKYSYKCLNFGARSCGFMITWGEGCLQTILNELVSFSKNSTTTI